jgi:hypothetical protein
LPDSDNVFNDSPHLTVSKRIAMAIEITPPILDLAEGRKRRRDMRALWRLSAWGSAAAVSLAALAITTQTEGGSERLAYALSPGTPRNLFAEITDLKRRTLEKDAETKRLEAQVVTLALDRERLTSRLASIERNLDDMTGSIKKQASVAPPVLLPLAMPAIAAPSQAMAAAPEPVPLPPVRMANAPAVEDSAEPPKLEFGIDLGGAVTMDVLSARWAAVKANFGPLLTGLHPLAAPDTRPGSTGFRLLVGPVANPAAGMQLCARFAAVRISCRTAKFAGEQLAQR